MVKFLELTEDAVSAFFANKKLAKMSFSDVNKAEMICRLKVKVKSCSEVAEIVGCNREDVRAVVHTVIEFWSDECYGFSKPDCIPHDAPILIKKIASSELSTTDKLYLLNSLKIKVGNAVEDEVLEKDEYDRVVFLISCVLKFLLKNKSDEEVAALQAEKPSIYANLFTVAKNSPCISTIDLFRLI